jgi:hypothetical protein
LQETNWDTLIGFFAGLIFRVRPVIIIYEPNQVIQEAIKKIERLPYKLKELVLDNTNAGGYSDHQTKWWLFLNQRLFETWDEIPITNNIKETGSIKDILDENSTRSNPREFLRLKDLRVYKTDYQLPTQAKITLEGTIWSAEIGERTWVKVFDENFPAPCLNERFLIETMDPVGRLGIRPIRTAELARAFGMMEDDIVKFSLAYSDDEFIQLMTNMISSDHIQTLLLHLYMIDV